MPAPLAAHRPARLALLLALAASLAACGGGPDPRETEGRAVFATAKKRHALFVAFSGVGPAGPYEAHLVSWCEQNQRQIADFHEMLFPLQTSGLHRETFQALLLESDMYARLAQRMKQEIAGRGGEAENRDATLAQDTAVWNAIRAAREVQGAAQGQASLVGLPEVAEAQAVEAKLKAEWPQVDYNPERNGPARR